MVVFPVLAAVIATVFTAACFREGARRRSRALQVWGFALLQFAVASAALAWGVGLGWTAGLYRLYYAFGAVVNVAWLGLGTVWLLAPRPLSRAATWLMAAASLYALYLVSSAELVAGAAEALAREDIPAGSAVMPGGARALSRWFSIGGSVVVLGGLAWSAVRRRAGTAGLVLLAIGVVVVGLAGEFARFGAVAPFSIGLAAGVALMYLGFSRSTRPQPAPRVPG